MMASWNHIFSPTSVLEVKFGRNVPTIPNPTINTKIQRPEFLSKAGLQMFQTDVLGHTIPNFSAAGEFSVGGGAGIQGDRIYQYIGNFSKVIGRSSRRGGGNYSRRHFFNDTSNPMDGNADFDPRLTGLSSNANSGDSFASMLLGFPSTIRRGRGNTTTNANINVQEYYVQDDWRVSNKLTLNLRLPHHFIPAPLYDTN